MKRLNKKNKIFQLIFVTLFVTIISIISPSFAKYVYDLGVVGNLTIDVIPTSILPTADEFREKVESERIEFTTDKLRVIVFDYWDVDNGYIDENRGVTISPSEWEQGENVDNYGAVKVFIRKTTKANLDKGEEAGQIAAYILSEDDIIAPQDSTSLFSGANQSAGSSFRTVYYIDLINFHLPDSDVFNATNMFRYCLGLKELDLSSWSKYNSSINKIVLHGAFYNCSSLTHLNLSGIDFERNGEGSGCNDYTFQNTAIETLDISNTIWREGGLTYLFHAPSSIKKIIMTGIDTTQVHNIKSFFNGKSNLVEIVGFEDFDTDSLSLMRDAFKGCSNLPDKYFLQFAENLKKGNKVTSCYGAFSSCKQLTASTAQRILNAISGNTLTSIYDMFSECSGIEGELDLSGLNLSQVTSLSSLFQNCTKLTSVNLSGLNVSNVKEMTKMFYGCTNLTTIYVDNTWTTSKVTKYSEMFSGCTNLKGGNGTVYDSNKTGIEYARADEGPSNPGYFTLVSSSTT